jgi:predicted lipoprotein with Yx(FWY)xxD motif
MTHGPSTPRRRLAARATACVGAAALAAAPLVLVGASTAAAATPTLKSANIPGFSGVLENSSSHSLYLLSVEKGTHLKCTKSACLNIWHPLDVRMAVRSITVGKGVNGKITFVRRSATMKQVVFNTYPVYTYAGDTGPNQSNGEGIADTGGVWHLLHAGAKTVGATPVPQTLDSASIPSYANVLAGTTGRSFYVLSAEKGAVIKCTAGCLSIWPPLLVPAGTKAVSIGTGVKGTIGFLTRGTMLQVTFNSFPVYVYSGDSGAHESNGEGIIADGGTWTLASAPATTATATPVPPVVGGGGW